MKSYVEGTLTLNEYKMKIAQAKDLVREELSEIADDEVLLVMSRWRDDDDIINMRTWHEVFIDFNEMIKYMLKKSEWMVEDDGEEPIAKRLYWEVDKCKRADGKMEKLFECAFGADGALLTSRIGRYFRLYGDYTKRQREICDYEYLLKSPRNIILPYKTGDILLVDALPFAKPFYVVYGGGMSKGEQRMSDHHYYHWCLYMSDDRRGLDIDDLSEHCFSDYILFRNSPLNMLSLAENCVEPLIVKAGEALKENPDLWFEWVEIWSKRRIDEGGLEQWIFLYSGL